MADVVVNVALDDQGQQDPDACVAQLEAHGLRRAALRRMVGIVTGEASEDSVEHLRGVRGVRTVEVDRTVWALTRGQPGPAGGSDRSGPAHS